MKKMYTTRSSEIEGRVEKVSSVFRQRHSCWAGNGFKVVDVRQEGVTVAAEALVFAISAGSLFLNRGFSLMMIYCG